MKVVTPPLRVRLGQTLVVSWRRRAAGRGNPVRDALVRYVASALLAVVLVSLLGVWLFRRAGEAEAIRDAKDQTRIAAEGSVEPAVTDRLVRGDPKALAAVDRVVQERVLSDPLQRSSIARVKIWDSSGRIVYSDEPRLIGARYAMSAEDLAAFREQRVSAEVSDLSKPENRFERRFGRLLEVYLPIHTPSGAALRYETYYRSSFISARARRISRQFAPVMLGALALLVLIQLPLAWRLARRVQSGQDEREQLLRRAVEASDAERRRIARDLHDGVVQDLAAVSYSLTAAADGAPQPYGDPAADGGGRDEARAQAAPHAARRDLPARAAPGRPRGGARRPRLGVAGARDRDRARGRAGARPRPRDGGALLPRRAGSAPERRQARRRDARPHRPRPGERPRTADRRRRRPRLRPRNSAGPRAFRADDARGARPRRRR